MSFKQSDLSILAYTNNFTLWHYATETDDPFQDGYFDKAADMLRENDLIIINGPNFNTSAWVSFVNIGQPQVDLKEAACRTV